MPRGDRSREHVPDSGLTVGQDAAPQTKRATMLRPRDLVWHNRHGLGVVVAWGERFGDGLSMTISLSLFNSVPADVPYAVAFPLTRSAAAFATRRHGILPRLAEPLAAWPTICTAIRAEADSVDPASAVPLPGRWWDAGPALYCAVSAMDNLGLRALLDDLSPFAEPHTRARHALCEWVAADSLREASRLAAESLGKSCRGLHPLEVLVVAAAQRDVDAAVDERLDRELATLADRVRNGLARTATERGRTRLAAQVGARLAWLRGVFGALRRDRIAEAERGVVAALGGSAGSSEPHGTNVEEDGAQADAGPSGGVVIPRRK